MPIGLLSCVKAASPDSMRAFYRRWYRPELMTLYIVGPFAPAAAAAAAPADAGDAAASAAALPSAPSSPGPQPAPYAPQYGDVMRLVTTLFGAEGGSETAEPAPEGSPAPPAATGVSVGAAAPPSSDPSLALIPGPAPGRLLRPMRPFPNAHPPLPHVYDRPPSRPLVIVQTPLLSRFALSLSSKRPLREHHVLSSRAAFAAMVLDVVLSSAFDMRISALRSASAAPVFSSLSWDDSPAAEEGCAFVGLQVAAEVEDDAAAIGGAPAAAVDDAPASVGEAAAPPATSPSAHPRWRSAVTLAFREALRLRRHGLPPKELQLAVQAVLKDVRDSAARAASEEHAEVLEELQGAVYTGSAMPSAAQEWEWVKAVAADITPARAAERLLQLLGFVETVVGEARAAAGTLAAAQAPASADGASASSVAAAAWAAAQAASQLPVPEQHRLQLAQEAAVTPSLFAASGLALSLFVCAPGPLDTVADAIPGAADRMQMAVDGEEGGEGVEGGSAGAAGGLLERLAQRAPASRRGRLARLLSDDEEDEDEEDEEDDEEGEGEEEGDESASGSEAGSSPAGSRHRRLSSAGSRASGVGSGSSVGSGGRGHKGGAQLSRMLLPVELLAAIAQADAEEDGRPLQPAPDIDLPDCLVAPAAVAARQAAAAAALGLRAREAMAAEEAAATAPAQAWYEPLPAPDAAAAASAALAPFSLNDVAPIMLPPHSGADSSSSSSPPPAGAAPDLPSSFRCVDPLSGLVTLRLRNGMQLVYRPSRYEPHTVAVTLLARGGKEVEGATGWGYWPEAARYGPRCGSGSPVPPFPAGASDLALRALLSSSAGGHAAATIERLCGLWGLSMSSSAAAETLAVTCSAVSSGSAIAEVGASSDGGVATLPTDAAGIHATAAAAAAAPSALLVGGGALSESGVALSHILQLLHLFLFACEWDEGALARCREDKASELADLPTSLEQLTDLALVLDSYGHGEASVQVPTPSAVRSYPTAMLQGCMAAQLHPGNLQLVVTGDCAWWEVEALVAAYLGPWTPEAAGRHLAPLPADAGGAGAGAGVGTGAASLGGAAGPVYCDPLSPLCALTPSSYVTPAAGDTVTALSPAGPQPASGGDASDEEEGESEGEGEGAEPHDVSHTHGSCEHSHGSKQRGPGKRPAGSRMRKTRGKAAAAAAAAATVKLHRETLPVPPQLASAMRLHASLLRVLEGTGERAAAGASTGASTAGTEAPAEGTAADAATGGEVEQWVPPLTDASGHLAWVAPFSGSVADMLAALGRAAAGTAAASPGAVGADAPATATPVPRPVGVPLPPVLLSGRVLTVPQERKSRCILSATCPALGKYWQDMVAQAGRAAAAAAASGSAAGAAAGSLLASGSLSLRDVDAALAALSPGFDTAALPVLLPGPSAEAVRHAASAPLSGSPPSVRGVNRRHPLFLYRCANVWSEVINNRMYRVLRDESGSCYSAGFSLSGYEFRQGGFGHVTATPIPAHTATVLAAAVRVLVGTLSGGWPLSAAEVEEARTPVVHEIASNLRTNGYWIRLAQHQGGFHGSRRSVAAALYGMQAFYEQVTPADVQAALAFEWAAAPHPLPLHVVVGVAAGPTAKGGRKGRQGGRRRASSGESGAAGHAGGEAAAAHAATLSAIRRELGLPAAAAKVKGSRAASAGAEGAPAGSGHARDHALAHLSLPEVWEDLVAAASRAFYAGKA